MAVSLRHNLGDMISFITVTPGWAPTEKKLLVAKSTGVGGISEEVDGETQGTLWSMDQKAGSNPRRAPLLHL